MATQAKVIIKGENNISSAVKSASNDLNALKGSVEKIGSVMKTAFSVTAIILTGSRPSSVRWGF